MQFMQDIATSPLSLAIGTVGVSVATAYFLANKPRPFPAPLDFNNQSIKLPDGSRTSVWVPDGKSFIEFISEDARTTYETFQKGVKLSRNRRCLGTRTGPNKTYMWLTYHEVNEQIKAFGAGLLQEGLKPGNKTIVGIYASNRVEWVVAEQACVRFSMVTTALYDTLGPDTCAFIINQTEMETVICDQVKKAQQLLNQADILKSLKCIIVMDDIPETLVKDGKQRGIRILPFVQVMENGRLNPAEAQPPSLDDVCMICYTSGTTGDPKGAMLTHRCLIADLSSIVVYAERSGAGITQDDCHLSYLPLAHVYERGLQIIMFMCGASVGFSSGDVKLLTDDMQALKPTIFPTVPRLLNRMYDKVISGVKSSAIKSKLFKMAMAAKERDLKNLIIRKDSIWDKLVFQRIQKLVGGRVRLVFTASAPMETRVLNFARCAFGCVVVEGYGQTESAAGITFNIPGEYMSGHVGPPLPCNIVKLVDVPEMDYYASDNKGEVTCFGPSVFSGYFKNEEKTKEAIDDDGWLHTGDVGEWLPNGCLRIIDRKKNIFKLQQGEYVAAEKIENTYLRSEYVAQAFIEGDSRQSFILGVMVPDEEVLAKWAEENNVPGGFKDWCKMPDVKDMILQDLNAIGKKAGLKGFEMARDIIVHDELFSIENNLLTPTFKNKRPQLRKFFQSKIQELYAKLSGPSPDN